MYVKRASLFVLYVEIGVLDNIVRITEYGEEICGHLRHVCSYEVTGYHSYVSS